MCLKLRGVLEIGEKTIKIAASMQIDSSCYFTQNLFNISVFILKWFLNLSLGYFLENLALKIAHKNWL